MDTSACCCRNGPWARVLSLGRGCRPRPGRHTEHPGPGQKAGPTLPGLSPCLPRHGCGAPTRGESQTPAPAPPPGRGPLTVTQQHCDLDGARIKRVDSAVAPGTAEEDAGTGAGD